MTSGKSYYVFILKTVVALASLWFIHRQVVVKEDFRGAMEQYRALFGQDGVWLTLAALLALMALNWTAEALKWRFLIRPIQRVSAGRALAAILSGITVSFFTPNRIGEYAGRVLHLHSRGRIKAVIATVVGSMNQLLITVLAGGIAVVFFLRGLMLDEVTGFIVVAVLLCAGLAFITVAYFNIAAVHPWLGRFKWLQRFDRFIRVLSYYHRRELLVVTAYSVFRYVVFTVQFAMLLELFGATAEWLPVVRQTALMFLFMSVVPTFALTELTVRGSVALTCLGPLVVNSTGIVSAAFSLWFLNLVIPAVAGAISLLFIRYTERNS